MDSGYTYASLENKDELLNQISKIESELTQQLGQKVVLIAYTPRD